MPPVIKPDIKKRVFENLNKIHSIIPQTKCKRRNECCKAGCPHMYFVEFVYILDYIKDNVSRDVLLNVIFTCIDNFFSDDVIKICPLFTGDGCYIYQARSVNCRLYGIIPDEIYKKRQNRPGDEFTMSAEEIKEALGLTDINEVPLYHQCPYVSPIKGTGEEITVEVYNQIFDDLANIEKDFIQESGIDIPFTSYKTFHDHYLWFVGGDEMLEKWTYLKLNLKDDPILKESIVSSMKEHLKDVM